MRHEGGWDEVRDMMGPLAGHAKHRADTMPLTKLQAGPKNHALGWTAVPRVACTSIGPHAGSISRRVALRICEPID